MAEKTPPGSYLLHDDLGDDRPPRRDKKPRTAPTTIDETKRGDVVEIQRDGASLQVRVMFKYRYGGAHVRLWVNELEFGHGFNVDGEEKCKAVRTQ